MSNNAGTRRELESAGLRLDALPTEPLDLSKTDFNDFAVHYKPNRQYFCLIDFFKQAFIDKLMKKNNLFVLLSFFFNLRFNRTYRVLKPH